MLPAMDARTRKHEVENDTADEARLIAETITIKRDRLLASLTLIAGIGLIIMIPFALRAGAEFFLRVFFAIGRIVVPATDWVPQFPGKIPQVRATLEPVIRLYKHLDRWIER